MLTLPEHLILPLDFIEVHVALSLYPYFMLLACLLDFDCSFCLIHDCLVSIFLTFITTANLLTCQQTTLDEYVCN